MEIYHPKDDELLREMKRVRRVQKRKRLLWGLLVFLVLGAAFGWFVFNRYCTLTVFRGPAMGDTLADGSLILVWREGRTDLQRGDIILYETETGTKMKRVLAVSGDQILISPYAQTRVNGNTLEEPYTVGRTADTEVRVQRYNVEEGSLLVQGDQLSLSVDSRYPDYETVKTENVVGKAKAVLWPVNRMGLIGGDEKQEQTEGGV